MSDASSDASPSPVRKYVTQLPPPFLMEDPALPAGTKLLAVYLTKYGFSNGTCFASIDTLAEETGECTRSISLALSRLSKRGYITMVRDPSSKTGRRIILHWMDSLGFVLDLLDPRPESQRYQQVEANSSKRASEAGPLRPAAGAQDLRPSAAQDFRDRGAKNDTYPRKNCAEGGARFAPKRSYSEREEKGECEGAHTLPFLSEEGRKEIGALPGALNRPPRDAGDSDARKGDRPPRTRHAAPERPSGGRPPSPIRALAARVAETLPVGAALKWEALSEGERHGLILKHRGELNHPDGIPDDTIRKIARQLTSPLPVVAAERNVEIARGEPTPSSGTLVARSDSNPPVSPSTDIPETTIEDTPPASGPNATT